jgi:hypothetical protein
MQIEQSITLNWKVLEDRWLEWSKFYWLPIHKVKMELDRVEQVLS